MAVLSRNLSSDGNRFFFQTPDALVAADTNGEDGCEPWGSSNQRGANVACQDVYEWEAPGTGSCETDAPAYSPANDGCIYLISTGESEQASFLADASADGSDVFIFTFEQLVGQDKDELLDVYDARIGGGLSSQNVVESAPCAGEGCRGQASGSPTAQSPGSAGFVGPADPRPNRSKARGKQRRRKHAKHRRGRKVQRSRQGARRHGKRGQRAKKRAKRDRRRAAKRNRAKRQRRAAKQNGRAGR
jgi:hypothetical protein